MNYKQTLRLPRTEFALDSSVKREEERLLGEWQERGLHAELQELRSTGGGFVLHDGPPYARRELSWKHVLNKVLKDVHARSQSMLGRQVSFVPGWDCHGLPVELEVLQSLSEEDAEAHGDPLAFRGLCREYARSAIESHQGFFERLGIQAPWGQAYLTMSAAYEAEVTRTLARLIREDSLSWETRPVHWCPSCTTALSEMEVSYREGPCESLYIGFPLVSDPMEVERSLRGRDVEVLVWSDAPWSLPGSFALAIHPHKEYAVVRSQRRFYILAQERLEMVSRECGWGQVDVTLRCQGQELVGLSCRHPLIHRKMPLLASEHVSMGLGSGCTQVAPAHDRVDHRLAEAAGIKSDCPIDAQGRFSPQVHLFAGQVALESAGRIIRKLHEWGALLNPNAKAGEGSRRRPHCRRCSSPTLVRSTPQWFLVLERGELQQQAIEAVEEASWKPEWTRTQITQALREAPDWCISRQRRWGVPLPVFYCKRCGRPLLDPDFIEALADRYEQHPTGSDLWYQKSAEQWLGSFDKKPRCSRCHLENFRKEEDVVDVWVDAGLSFQASGLEAPIDLYWEGQEQVRAWFQSALLLSVRLHQKLPSSGFWAHGSVAPGDDVPAPAEALERWGAEALRVWAVYAPTHREHRISAQHLQLHQRMRHTLRNTCRFLMANLYDFSPERDLIAFGQMMPFEQAAMQRLQGFVERCRQAYEEGDAHGVLRRLDAYAARELSAFAFEVLKERLYLSAAGHLERQSAQSFFHHALHALVRVMAPIYCFTADEIWTSMPSHGNDPWSVHLTHFSTLGSMMIPEGEATQWAAMMRLRRIPSRAREGRDFRKMRVELAWEEMRPWAVLDGIEPKTLAELLGVVEARILASIPEASPTQEGSFQLRRAGVAMRFFPMRGAPCKRCACGQREERELCSRCHRAINEKKPGYGP